MVDRDEPRFDPAPEPPKPDPLPPEPSFKPEPTPHPPPDRPETPGLGTGPPTPAQEELIPQEQEPWYGQDRMVPGFDSSRARRARRLGRTVPFWWLIGALVLGIVVVAFLFFRDDSSPAQEPPALEASPETATPLEVLPEGQATAPAVEEAQPTPVPTAPPVFEVGQQVVVANTDGEGIRLRSAPGLGSLTLEIYEEGRAFQILEPGPEYPTYPVEADGYRWYRVQVADDPEDQLSGWVAGEFLAPQP